MRLRFLGMPVPIGLRLIWVYKVSYEERLEYSRMLVA